MEIRKILIPIDFSPVTESAVREGADLARRYKASIVLLTAIDDTFPHPELFSLDLPNEDFYRTLRHRAEERMATLIASCCQGVQIDHVVARGRPAKVIVEFAEAEKIDLIVMSTHGTGGWSHVLLGSVTERVLGVAPCPVLVLRVPEEDSGA